MQSYAEYANQGWLWLCCYHNSTCEPLIWKVLPTECPGGMGCGQGPRLLSTKSHSHKSLLRVVSRSWNVSALTIPTVLTPNIWAGGFPRWLSSKEYACQCRRHRRYEFVSWVGKSPWRREWQPTPVFLPGNTMDRGAWWATVHRVARSRTRLSNWARMPTSGQEWIQLIWKVLIFVFKQVSLSFLAFKMSVLVSMIFKVLW